MANIFYKTTGNFSALNPQVVTAGYFIPASAGTRQGLNVTRHIPFTPAFAGNAEGAMLCFRVSVVDASNVTCVLQEFAGAVWNDRATRTLTAAQIVGAHATPGGCIWCYFEFVAPFAVTAVPATWRLKLDGPATVYITLNGANYLYAVVLVTPTVFAPGDNIYIKDAIVVTMDQAVAAATIVMGCNSTWTWGNAPAASYELDIDHFAVAKDCRLEAGDSGNRIPAAQLAVVDIADIYTYGLNTDSIDWEVSLWGAKPTNVHTTLAANAAAAQPNIVTTDDMSADWAIGNTLIIMGTDDGSGYRRDTIANIVGVTITMTNNLPDSHYAGWAVWNETKQSGCGVKVEALDTTSKYNTAVIELSGIWAAGCNMSFSSIGIPDSVNGATRFLARTFDLIFNTHQVRMRDLVDNYDYTTGSVFKEIYIYGTSSNQAFQGTGHTDATYQDIYVAVQYGRSLWIGESLYPVVNSDLTDIQACGAATWVDTGLFYIVTASCVCTRLRAMHAVPGNYGALMLVDSGSMFVDCVLDGGIGNFAVYCAGSVIDTVFSNCEFDQDNPSGTATFGGMTAITVRILCTDCSTFTVDVTDMATFSVSSFIKSHNFNDVANDHRSWWKYGRMQSTGWGLADATAHTVGAGLFAIRFEPLSSVNNLAWDIDTPTGDIQNLDMMVGVWCKINHANYYAGVHQLPRLTIDYDDGSTAFNEAAANTNWQYLSVPITPLTTFGQITLTVSGRTDAVGSDAYIYWDDFSVLYPAGVAVNLGGIDLWAEGMPIGPPIATVLSALDVWSVAKALYSGAAGTFGQAVYDMEVDVDAVLVDTNEMQGKLPTNNIMGSSDVNDHDTDIDAILVDTGVTIPATLATLAIEANVQGHATAALNAYDPSTRAENIADRDQILVVTNAILVDTGVTLPATLAAIQASVNAIENDIFTHVMEGALTFEQYQRIMFAVLAGLSGGGGTPILNFRNLANTVDRVNAQVDATGNRLAIVLNGA